MNSHILRNIPSSLHRAMRTAAGLLLALGAAACTDQALISPEGARPGLDLYPAISLTPNRVFVGDTGVVLTIRGTGFTEYSHVWIDPWIATTHTFVDDSTLSVRILERLQNPAVYQMRVISETGEASAQAQLLVEYPVPVLDRITPEWCETPAACGPLTLHGRDFMPGSNVLWNGASVPAHWLNDSTITLQPSPGSLQSPSLPQVAVRNPAPGGGASASLTLQVGMRVIMHTAAARAGGGAFELEIYGEAFSSGAVVYWNGSPRQTTYNNSGRVSAWITAGDVAAPGEGVVTLSTPQLNQGQPFRVGTIAVRPLPPPAPPSQLTLSLPVRGLAYSAFTKRLYGTVYTGTNAGTVAVIDPATGAVERYIPIGFGPRYLAVSDDGKLLWVGVDGERLVRRVNLAYGDPDVTIELDSLVAEDLAAVPGQPGAVAVARRNPFRAYPDQAGVAVYDDNGGFGGSMRPAVTPNKEYVNVIEFGSLGSRLYGMENNRLDGRYRTMRVDPGGVVMTSSGVRVGAYPGADFVFAGGRLYTNQGRAVDTGNNDVTGSFAFNNDGAVRPDLQTGRVFYLSTTGIRVGDINTFTQLGTLAVPPLQFESTAGQRRHLVRWGTDGLAWHDADQVFVLRSALIGP